jgi:hypothetical protein
LVKISSLPRRSGQTWQQGSSRYGWKDCFA